MGQAPRDYIAVILWASNCLENKSHGCCLEERELGQKKTAASRQEAGLKAGSHMNLSPAGRIHLN